MSNQAKLTRGSIPGHLVKQTVPMIIGVAAIMSISLIDAYFIGQLGRTHWPRSASSSRSPLH